MRSLWFLLTLVACALDARAANIEIRPIGPGMPELIVVYGELVPSDIDRFNSLASVTSKAIVAFAGPGGSVVTGTTIGEITRLKGFDTVVLSGYHCASACALAWLGGARRYLSEGAGIGFHAARDVRSGDASGFGNALVGAYLNKIGLPIQAILYITAAQPDSMIWLNVADAQAYGIDVQYLAAPASENPAALKQDMAASPLQTAAIAFVQSHAVAQSAPPTTSVEMVRPHYADAVYYFGKHLSREAVLTEYRTFLTRWPERNYQIRTAPIEAQCFPGSGVLQCDCYDRLDCEELCAGKEI